MKCNHMRSELDASMITTLYPEENYDGIPRMWVIIFGHGGTVSSLYGCLLLSALEAVLTSYVRICI